MNNNQKPNELTEPNTKFTAPCKACGNTLHFEKSPNKWVCGECDNRKPNDKFEEARDNYEEILRTKTHLSYNDLDGFSYRTGANWALPWALQNHHVVLGLVRALELALPHHQGEHGIGVIMRKAYGSYQAEVNKLKGGE